MKTSKAYIEMNKHQIKARAELGIWFRKTVREELLDYYRLFRGIGLAKKIAYELAKVYVNEAVNEQIKRNFNGPKHLLEREK